MPEFFDDFPESDAYAKQLALNTLYSLSAADALGAATEFKTPQTIRNRYGESISDYQIGSVFGFAAGEATDDSQMTVATLLGYKYNCGFEGILQSYLEWLQSHPPDAGSLVRQALAFSSLNGGVQAWSDSNYYNAGNGGLMRVAAVWIAGHSGAELAFMSAGVTALTHADPRCVYASLFLTALLEALAEGRDFHSAAHAALELIERLDARAMLMSANIFGVHQIEAGRVFWEHQREARAQVRGRVLRALAGEYTTQSGYVLDTLEAAVCHAAKATDWLSAVQAAVMLGDDSDTVACIVGAIVGARGFELPEHLLPTLRLGHTWGSNECGWRREWLCNEHYGPLLDAVRLS